MFLLCRLALGMALLFPLGAAGRTAPCQQLPHGAAATEIEVGKVPFVSAATFVCGPLERVYPFDPQTYGKVSGYAPVRSSNPPIVLYAAALDPGFFRLAKALDSLVATDRVWLNSLVIIIDAKGAQRGGYTVEEVIQRRKSLRQVVRSHHLTHLSFFLSAPGAKSMLPRLNLTGSQDLLLSTLDSHVQPEGESVVRSVLRLESDGLTAEKCKETVAALIRRRQ